MPISSSQAGSSSDIELPVLISHTGSCQLPPHEQASSSSPISETNFENRTANPTVMIDGIEPPIPAYSPPSNNFPPIPISSIDAGLLEYTRTHGHSEMPLSPRQREDDRTSVQASEVHGDVLPAYGADRPPAYPDRPKLEEPETWPMLCFKLGFLFPPFWLYGALTLITPQDSLSNICMPWFQDFVPSAGSWCQDLQTEAEKEAYLARMRVAEIRWAKRCLFAFSLVLCFVIAVAVVIIGITKAN